MNSIALFFETKQGKYIKNLIIGLGAAIVLLGALFKLQHWQGAGLMLTVGMVTEAFLFTMMGLLPPHKDYYWERYYPNLDENPHIEAYKKGTPKGKSVPQPVTVGGAAGGNTAALDKMLEDAQITPTNLSKLNENFQKFGLTVSQMKDISEIASATGEYTQAVKDTTGAMGEMKSTFAGATQTMTSFNNAAEDTTRFHEQVQVLSKNLGSLNQLYEVELQDANNHLKAMNKFYSNLVSASDAMAASATDAQAAKEQIAMLSKNLTSLNQIYGNMLTAMQGR